MLKPPAERVKVGVKTSYGAKVLTILHQARGAMEPQKTPGILVDSKRG
jgi:hypothetical protein